MMRISISKKSFHPSVFVAPSAAIFGEVTLGRHSSVWFNTVIRADMAPVSIGEYCNIQDNSVIHVDAGHPTILGDRVSVGHGAIIHGAEVGDNCIIGIGARLLNRSKVGECSIVGAGCVVTEGCVIPPFSLVLGIPGKVVKAVDSNLKEIIDQTCNNYLKLKEAYLRMGNNERKRRRSHG